VRQAVPYALYYLGAPLLLILPYVAIFHFRVFGAARLCYYPLAFLANCLVGWLLGLWLATLWADRHRRRFEAELRRPE
jgi:ABC-type polysaccharide/polyol phosphate export permease